MQTMECLLSCNSAIKALRLEPSRIPGRMLLGSVILKNDTGDVFKTWDFAQRQE